MFSRLAPRFLLQQIFAVSICYVFGFAITMLARAIPALWNAGPDAISLKIAEVIMEAIILAAPFWAGMTIPARFHRGLALARWTSILPVAAFFLLFIDEVRRFGLGPATIAFFSLFSREGGDDERLASFFFTLPTWSAIAYSFGAIVRYRKCRKSCNLCEKLDDDDPFRLRLS